ncbi:MAG: hypothetical protein P1U56_03980 [Saprospiraceae bacterium]|nr:hypothetical protein [Saprospiraceae bacterium]
MKLKNALFLTTILFIVGCGDDERNLECLPSNLQSGIIAAYTFNGGSLTDDSSNSNDLVNTTSANAATDRNGNQKCAFQFDNRTTNAEFLTTTNTTFLNNLDDFSISIWYQPIDNTRDGGIYEVLLGRGEEGRCPDRRGEWSVGLYDCRRAVFGHDNSVWAKTVTGFSDGCQGEVEELTDKWHHVVAIKKGDTYTLYFNGNLDDTVNGDANCGNPYSAQDIGDLFVGSNYTGKVDDIIIYDRVLTQVEVTTLFELEPCCE